MRRSRLPWLLLGLSLSAQAAEWSLAPRVSLASGYNDNVRLTSAAHDSVMESSVTATANLGVATENTGLFTTLGASTVRFSGGSGANRSERLDRENFRLDTNTYYRSVRNELRGNLGFLRDSTLDSQLDETGIAQTSRADRLRTSFGASWRHIFNTANQINLGYSANKNDFSGDTGADNLIESDSSAFSFSFTHRFSPLTQGTVSTSYSRFKPDTGFDSDTINLQAGITRTFSETLSTTWLAGGRRTTADTLISTGFCIGAIPGAAFPACTGGTPFLTGIANDEIENTGTVFSVTINKQLDTGQLSATASRDANPGSNGELLETTRASLSGVHRFTERLRTTLQLSYINSETLFTATNGTSVRDNDFYQARAALTWQWFSNVTLGANYTFLESKPANGDKATSNALFLTLSYQPNRLSVSR